MIEGIDFPGLLRKVNFIMSRIYNSFAINTYYTASLINKTGAPTVRGELVKADTATDEGFILTATLDDECIGVIAEGGIADGARCLIATGGGVVEVMLEDGTGSTSGDWLSTGPVTPGRANSGGAPVPARHFEECGHSVQTVAGGTDVLVKIIPHFN